MNVFLVVIKNLLLAGRLPLGIVVDRFPEARQVFESVVLRQLRHLVRYPRYLLEPDLMDIRGWNVDGRHRFHRFSIAPFPVCEAFDRKLGSSFWSVLGSLEIGELDVS